MVFRSADAHRCENPQETKNLRSRWRKSEKHRPVSGGHRINAPPYQGKLANIPVSSRFPYRYLFNRQLANKSKTGTVHWNDLHDECRRWGYQRRPVRPVPQNERKLKRSSSTVKSKEDSKRRLLIGLSKCTILVLVDVLDGELESWWLGPGVHVCSMVTSW